MKTLTPVSGLLTTRLLAAVCLGLGLVVVAAPVSAEPLDLYTGYTRPGTVRQAPLEKGVLPVGEAEADLGMTIYYKVYRVQDILHSDSLLTGVKDIDDAFVPGKDPAGRYNSPKFDGRARYLYLYQVVNDSGRNGIGRSVSVQLMVPPENITSWGHFVMRNENQPARGLSFAMEVPDKARKGRSEIWAVSADHNPVKADQRAFVNPSPYRPRPDLTFDLQPILIGNIVAAASEAEAVGREPDRVMIVADPTFKPRVLDQPNPEDFLNAPPMGEAVVPAGPGAVPAFGPGVGFSPAPTFWNNGGFLMVNPFEYRQTAMAPEPEPSNLVFRAYFGEPLSANQRSTVFGFTSDLPPIYLPAQIRGTTKDKLQAAGPGGVDPRSDSLIADGGVPSPTPAAAPSGGGGGGGNLGGVGGVSGPTGGGGGLGGGLGGGGFGGGGVPGGGGGETGGGGTTTGTTTTPTQQQQQQTTTPTPTPTPVTINNNNNNNNTAQAQAVAQQAQLQAQQQKQKQRNNQRNQHQHTPHQVVPEPAAAVSALLGLPLIWLVGRRLRRQQPAVAHATVS